MSVGRYRPQYCHIPGDSSSLMSLGMHINRWVKGNISLFSGPIKKVGSREDSVPRGISAIACLAPQKYSGRCVAAAVLGALTHVWLRGDCTEIAWRVAEGRGGTGWKGSSKPWLEIREEQRGELRHADIYIRIPLHVLR